MLSLDYIRRKIRAIETTSKITNAMYLVATASLRKCQKQFNNSQIFFNEFYKAVGNLLDDKCKVGTNMFNQNGAVYYVLIGSDIGLCGSYNSNVFKLLFSHLKSDDKVCLIGKKSLYFFKSNNLNKNIDSVINFPPGGVSIYFTQYIAEMILKKNMSNYRKIVVVYTKYRSALLFEPVMIQALPIDEKLFVKDNKQNLNSDYEPNKAEILENITPMFFSVFLHGALSESRLCENSSRRNSMKVATKNAENLIKKYKLFYNKVRQDKITQEIIEIVTGSSLDAQSL